MTSTRILVLRSCWRAFITIGIMALSMVTASAESYKGYTRPEAIITAKELHELMAKNSNVIVIAVASATQYHRGHIPGSIRVWRKDYEAPHGNGKEYPFEGMLANKKDFERFARKLGINNDSTVVIYDYQYDATRLWWAFYCYGKTRLKSMSQPQQMIISKVSSLICCL